MPDGFHEVETRLCKINVADTVSVELLGAGNSVALTCNLPGVPVDESNLAIRALRAFEQKVGKTHSWRLHLEKRIPFGAGLGGGSSNAAAVLLAMNDLCGQPLTENDLLAIGGTLGADEPCFILKTAAADGSGRGEKVVPAPFGWNLPLVLIKPAFPIPTPWAYKHWLDSQELPGVLYAPQICPWGEMVNGLERPVFEKHRLLPSLKTWLLEQKGVRAALMSGSGSTMFAVAESRSSAQAVAEAARAFCGTSAWIQVTETLADDVAPGNF